jgi:predicted RNA-binding protein Jag
VRINEQRRREMRAKARAARDEGRSKSEQVARARQEYLRELTARMRAALRLIVDAPVRKVQLDQLALFDEDECGTGR